MTILFIGMASAYTNGMTYQDQMLVAQCLKKGHEVFFVSDAHEFTGGKLHEVEERERILDNGLHLIQVKYDYIVCDLLTNKLRECKKIKGIIEKISPNIIYIHGPNSIAIKHVLRYKEKHPEVKLMVDSHADYYTSGTNFISRWLLHGKIYKRIYNDCIKYADKLYCISVNCMRFAEEVYKIPKDKIELYSLGGICLEEGKCMELRHRIRTELGYDENTTVFMQIGKMDEKKCLLEALESFTHFDNEKWRYVVIGNIEESIQEAFAKYLEQDKRIRYLGWKTGEEIIEYLAACDLYMQPGKVSAIAQNAMCMGVAVCLRNLEDYQIFVQGNGWLIDSPEEVDDVFRQIENQVADLKSFGKVSRKVARELLDYEKLAQKIYG